MRPLIRLWRSKGIKCVDDGIIAANGRCKAQKDSDFVKESLANAWSMQRRATGHLVREGNG